MPFNITGVSERIISVTLTSELSLSEVTQLQMLTVKAIERLGRIKVLLVLKNFQGWSRDGRWADSLVGKHDKDNSKIAVVGDEKWRDLVCAFLGKGFRDAAVEYFLPAEISKARDWLDAPVPDQDHASIHRSLRGGWPF